MELTKTVLIALIIFFSSSLSAQQFIASEKATDSTAKGSVEVIRDSRIDSIVKMHIAYNQTQDGIMGYRVQIFFDAGNNSLDRAEAAAFEYQTLYPGDTAYISFTEPYYKVRVGDFRTRIEAEGFMHKILGDYPNAFVIKDRIRFPEL